MLATGEPERVGQLVAFAPGLARGASGRGGRRGDRARGVRRLRAAIDGVTGRPELSLEARRRSGQHFGEGRARGGIELKDALIEQHVDRALARALEHELGSRLVDRRRGSIDQLSRLRRTRIVIAVSALGRSIVLAPMIASVERLVPNHVDVVPTM